MPTYSAQIPRPPCICTALYYDEDCPVHGRMYGAWRDRRAPIVRPAPVPTPTPMPTYPLVKLWLWMERISAGLRK